MCVFIVHVCTAVVFSVMLTEKKDNLNTQFRFTNRLQCINTHLCEIYRHVCVPFGWCLSVFVHKIPISSMCMYEYACVHGMYLFPYIITEKLDLTNESVIINAANAKWHIYTRTKYPRYWSDIQRDRDCVTSRSSMCTKWVMQPKKFVHFPVNFARTRIHL